MTQKSQVLYFLERNGSITLADALQMSPPCYRLSERIRELKKQGFEIESRIKEGKPYAEYTLKPKDKLF